MHENEIADAIDVQLRNGTAARGAHVTYSTATFKKGKRRWRAGRFVRVFDPNSGELKSEEFKLGTWTVSSTRALVTDEPSFSWRCENEEIELVRAFLNENLPSGKYKLVPADAGGLLDLIDGRLDLESATNLLLKLTEVDGLAERLASESSAETLTSAVEIHRRRRGLQHLREAVNAGHNELQLHPLVKGQSWIFGGHFIGEAHRRQLTIQSIVDIPLIRGDGSLHVVELKGCDMPRLVEKYRTAGFSVGSEVNRAVGQAQNYLRDLDENYTYIRQNLGIDCRRSSATVVIGDSRKVPEADANQVLEAVRSYNSFLSRVQVMTYDELVANAERSIALRPTDIE